MIFWHAILTFVKKYIGRTFDFQVKEMALKIKAEPIPLVTDKDGVVRVGNTRVTLDTVISTFAEGATAEEIVQQYPSLQLADVYSVISYYLKNHSEVEAYFQKRAKDAEKIRKQNEARFDSHGIRRRLLARQPKSTE